jgi:hypothetical protein
MPGSTVCWPAGRANIAVQAAEKAKGSRRSLAGNVMPDDVANQ